MTFNNIEELHNYLNQNPKEVKNCDDITKLIFNSVKLLSEEQVELKEKFELNRATFSFILEKDVLNPKATFPNEDGVMVSYPSIHYFDAEKLDYIEQIFDESSSHIVSGHLGHFLWINGKKHHKFLEKSKRGYLSIINSLIQENEQQIEESEKNLNYHQINWYLNRLLFVSQKLKATEEFAEVVLRLKNSEQHKFMHYAMISLMTENTKLFPDTELETLPILCMTRANEEDSHFSKMDYFKLGIRIDEVINKKSEPWKKHIADQYKILANERKDLAAIDFANKASRLYEEAGDSESAKEMANLYEEKSRTKQLGTVQTEIDVTDAVQFYDKVIDELHDQDIESILNYLRQSPQVLPPKSIVDKIVEKSLDYNQMRFFVGNQIFDANGHVAQHFTSEEEVLKMITLENYYQLINMRFDILVSRLMVKLLDKEGWNEEAFIETLSSISWLGQSIKKSLSNDRDIEVRYIDYLSPGITNYFDELRKWNNDRDNYEPNFTLAIDSLTLKIEGLLREICKQIGIQTFYIRHDDKERNITREKDINMLLREESLTEFLGEDLTIYLKSIFVERVGNNLRNEVAHSFLLPFQYKNIITMNKIIIAILRLSNWTLTTDEEE